MIKLFKFPEVRKKLFFTLIIIIAFRLLAHVPVPGVDTAAIKAYLTSNVFFGILDLFSGGGFKTFQLLHLV